MLYREELKKKAVTQAYQQSNKTKKFLEDSENKCINQTTVR